MSENDALRRARLYRAAGADVIFFEAPQTEEEIEPHTLPCRGAAHYTATGGQTRSVPWRREGKLARRAGPTSRRRAVEARRLERRGPAPADDAVWYQPAGPGEAPGFSRVRLVLHDLRPTDRAAAV